MAGGKQTPRQAMIGMMYLVLLAMLAMNASKDLLNAFLNLEDGIGVTTTNFNAGNQGVYDKIDKAALLGSTLAIQTQKKAHNIQSATNKIDALIEAYKKELIEKGGGVDEETGIPLGKDNQDIGAEFLITLGKGEALRNELKALQSDLQNYIDPKDTALSNSITSLLSTPEYIDPEGVRMSWEAGLSEHMPLAAVTANLANVQSYVRNAEAQMINYLYEEISSDAYKVNKIMATSIANNSYIMQGENYSANIFLAASDTTQEPIILVGDYDTTLFRTTGEVKFTGPVDTVPVQGGVGQFDVTKQDVGNHSWGGIMLVPHPNPKRKGEFLKYPFTNSFTVAAPTAVISSRDLNIMYKGVGNNIEISAPGVAPENLIVTCNGAIVNKLSNGKYEFKPTRTGEITINVSAKMPDGSEQVMGTQKWKSKGFPTANIYIGSKAFPDKVKKSLLSAIGYFKVAYSPDFPVSATPKILECKYEISRGQQTVKSGTFSRGVLSESDKQMVNSTLKKGDVFTVYIKVQNPDGSRPTLPAYTFKLL